MPDYMDQLMARGVVSDRAAAAAQDAREAAAARMRQAVQPEEGRQEGAITDWAVGMGENFKADIEHLADQAVHRPGEFAASLIGPGELGIVWSGAKRAAFQEMLRAGKTPAEIAEQFGITEGAVKALARTKGVPRGGITDVWSAPGLTEKLQELAAQGRSATQISREVGVSHDAVTSKAKALGLTLQRGETAGERSARIKRESAALQATPSEPSGPRVSEDNERALYDLMWRGMSDHEIAAEFGVSRQEVANKRPALERKYGSERALFDLMSRGLDDDELAAEFGVSRETMRNRRLDLQRKYGK